MMATRRGLTNLQLGVVGTVMLVAVVLAAMNFQKLPLVGQGTTYEAEFAEAGGLKSGSAVLVGGAHVGKVRGLELAGDRVRVAYTLDPGDLRLGRETEARIVTVTLLGEAALELVPRGSGRLDGDSPIPLARTSSPYDITSALSDLTGEVQAIDLKQLNAALGTVSRTFRDSPPDVRAALDGVDQLATALNSTDGALRSLLEHASDVSGVLASRNRQVGELLTSGSALLRELDARQQVVVGLLRGVRDLTSQLRALVHDNEAVLAPALRQLNRLTAQLNQNRTELQAILVGVRRYAMAFSDSVSSGPFFDVYVQNLTSPATVGPVVSGVIP